MVNALVLAGSKNDGLLSQCSQVPYEAMIPIGNKAMIEYVIDALRESPLIKEIVVVGPAEITGLFQNGNIKLVPPSDNIMDNVRRGVAMLPQEEKILLATSDIPLITSQAIEDFLKKCENQEADIFYPVISKEVVEKSDYYTKRTYVAFKEGKFTGGNLFLFNPVVVDKSIENGRQVVAARKSPLKLSRLLGLPFLIKFMLRKVSLAEAENKASELLKIRGKVIITHYPEVGVDVDKPSDLEMVCKYLN